MSRDELDILEARWRIRAIGPDDLHRIADELLAGGESTASLIELFALPAASVPWDGPALFDQTLVEFGGGTMTEDQAAALLARDIARGVLAGSTEPVEATARAFDLHIRTGYRFDCFHDLYALHEELGYLGRDNRTYLGRAAAYAVEDVHTECRRLLDADSR